MGVCCSIEKEEKVPAHTKLADILVAAPVDQDKVRKQLQSEVCTAIGAPAAVLKTTISESLDITRGAVPQYSVYSVDHAKSGNAQLSQTGASWREVIPPSWMENSSSTREPPFTLPLEKPLNPSPKSKYIKRPARPGSPTRHPSISSPAPPHSGSRSCTVDDATGDKFGMSQGREAEGHPPHDIGAGRASEESPHKAKGREHAGSSMETNSGSSLLKSIGDWIPLPSLLRGDAVATTAPAPNSSLNPIAESK